MDNTVAESCTVENIDVVLYPGDTFKELSGVTATYKSNDRADGTDVERELNYLSGQKRRLLAHLRRLLRLLR